MNRILIAIATLVFAVGAMLTSTAPAQAGWKGRLAVGLAIGAISAMSHHHRYEHRHWRKRRHHVRRRRSRKVYTAKRPSPSTEEIVKAEPVPPLPEAKGDIADAVAENENSSISTAAIEPVEETAATDTTEAAPEPVKVVAEVPETAPAQEPKTAKKLDCKKFFPAVGMTLSVPCE